MTTTSRLQNTQSVTFNVNGHNRTAKRNSNLKISKGAGRGREGGETLEGAEGTVLKSMKGTCVDATIQPFTSVTTPSSTCSCVKSKRLDRISR